MSLVQPAQAAAILLTIDIAKLRHDVLIEAASWKNRKRLILPNTAAEFRLFADYLHGLKCPVRVVFEAIGKYHRPLAHLLKAEGFHLELIASLAVARKQRLLEDVHRSAQSSIGIPVVYDSEAVAMFRVVLGEMIRLCQLRDQLEQRAALHLKDNADFQRLQQQPGIGPILALTILAEAGDQRRFSHRRQFLKFCGLDLSTQQSGQFRGSTKLSKYGNARLCCAFWMAATVAVRQTENSFRDKFERYLRRDPLRADRKRMAYVAVAAKMARVAHGIIRTGTDFRCFHEAAAPSGRAASPWPSRP